MQCEVLTADLGNLLLCVTPSGATIPSFNGNNLDGFMDKPYIYVQSLATNSQETVTIRQSFNIHQVDGLTKREFDADFTNYAAGVGANPTFYPQLSFSAASTGGSGASYTIRLFLTYYVEMYDRVILAQS